MLSSPITVLKSIHLYLSAVSCISGKKEIAGKSMLRSCTTPFVFMS
ncbi:hypothetical protein A2U01_0118932, partial [Trifolium medium]|nr:hypothetical protein [Trifolium medium]